MDDFSQNKDRVKVSPSGPELVVDNGEVSNPGSKPETFPDLGNDYEVLELLGEGGMGKVYKVLDKSLNKILAVKMIRAELAQDQSALKRFEQEAKTVTELAHPNLVAVYAGGNATDGTPYLVMDHIDGTTLATTIKQLGSMEVARALEIFTQICEALRYAHRRGVIHRDLKPSNIILEHNSDGLETAKVADFGIAKFVTNDGGETVNGLTQTGDIFGTPTYMSPEQCLAETLDERSDIYSLGCVMFETLCGSPPFADIVPFKVMTKHVNERAPEINRQGVSPPLRAVIAKCLEKQPNQRYQNVDELLEDLSRLRSDKPPKYAGRRRKLTWVYVAAGLITLLGMNVLFGMVSKPVQDEFKPSPVPVLSGMPIKKDPPLPRFSVARSKVEPIWVEKKPDFAKPIISAPKKPAEAPPLPDYGKPLSEAERSELRTMLFNVTPTLPTTVEPLLRRGKIIIPALLEEARSGDVSLERASAVALSRFGDSALPGLIEIFKVDSNRYIAQAIGSIGDRGVIALLPVLSSPDPDVRLRAATAIRDAVGTGNISPMSLPAGVVPVLLYLMLNDEDSRVRARAASVLSRGPFDRIRPALFYTALNDPKEAVRKEAAKTIGLIAPRDDGLDKETLDVLGWIVQHDTADVAISVTRSAGQQREFVGYLKAAYQKRDSQIKDSILANCYRDEIAEMMLPEILDSLHGDSGSQSRALSSLRSLGPRAIEVLPYLKNLKEGRVPDVTVAEYLKPYLDRAIESIER